MAQKPKGRAQTFVPWAMLRWGSKIFCWLQNFTFLSTQFWRFFKINISSYLGGEKTCAFICWFFFHLIPSFSIFIGDECFECYRNLTSMRLSFFIRVHRRKFSDIFSLIFSQKGMKTRKRNSRIQFSRVWCEEYSHNSNSKNSQKIPLNSKKN